MKPDAAGIESHRKKSRLYHLFTQVASALANPHRLELLDLLAQAPRTVEELAQETHMSVANTSQHLQRLKRARLVLDDREGREMRYRLAGREVASLWLELRAVADRQLGDVERALNAYRPKRHEFQRVSMEELRKRIREDEIVLIDVRPEEEYRAGHLPHAVSMPLEGLKTGLDELNPRKTIVAYCRGPYCVYADDALEMLVARGFRVARLEEGVAEWQQAGYAVERSS
jgi:rhodanese-related sulfurtransferase/predicted transcriptional regulator